MALHADDRVSVDHHRRRASDKKVQIAAAIRLKDVRGVQVRVAAACRGRRAVSRAQARYGHFQVVESLGAIDPKEQVVAAMLTT